MPPQRQNIIIKLKEAGIMEVEMYGLYREIGLLCNNLKIHEIIFKAALGFFNTFGGVFIVTNQRVLFLYSRQHKLHLTEYSLEDIVSIIYNKVNPETLTIHTSTSKTLLVLEGTRRPFCEETYQLINTYLKFAKIQ